ncbi:TetR family transcriptional regulator [Actinomadura nitritigenes]|uniref:TetR family transcriptional regulator n=1 Tax=Actinomadura nitritigenes TaxID=134602 RepID=UPI003D93AD62
MDDAERAGLRERTRRAVRTELAELALRLFVERGYEETTVDDIATAAGLSKRSFFRYFPSKEDVVFGDVEDLADRVAEAVRARPAEEPPWTVLRAVLREWGERIQSAQRDPAVLRLIESSPALRARLNQRRDAMRDRITTALCERPGPRLDAFTADLLTGCAAAALDAANREWLRCDGAADRTDLIDRAFGVMAPAL